MMLQMVLLAALAGMRKAPSLPTETAFPTTFRFNSANMKLTFKHKQLTTLVMARDV